MAPRSRLAALAALTALLAACTKPAPPASPASATPPATDSAAPTAGGTAPPRGAAAPGAPHEACRDPGTGPEPDAAALRAFVRKRSGQLRDCYQRALKRDASAGGKASFRFTIGTCGELTGVELASRRGRVDDAAACAVHAMHAWRTPFRPASPVTVEYPVAFSASM